MKFLIYLKVSKNSLFITTLLSIALGSGILFSSPEVIEPCDVSRFSLAYLMIVSVSMLKLLLAAYFVLLF